MENVEPVIVAALRALKQDGKQANIRKTNGRFYNGEVLAIDDEHVQIADRMVGPIVILLSEVSEVRESRVGGRE